MAETEILECRQIRIFMRCFNKISVSEEDRETRYCKIYFTIVLVIFC